MSERLTSVQEHYLKKELLKLQLAHELNLLTDPNGLKEFGFPFFGKEPETNKRKSASLYASSMGLSSISISSDLSTIVDDTKKTNAPLLNYSLRKLVMTFPLFARELITIPKFWQQKLQPFHEHYMKYDFMNDRWNSKESKSEKIAKIFTTMIYKLMNSVITTSQETQYFTNDKLELKRSYDYVDCRKAEKYGIFASDSLTYLCTTKRMYINNWSCNVIGVIDSKSITSNSKTANKDNKTAYSLAVKNPTKWMKNAFNASHSSSSAFFNKLSLNSQTGVAYKSKPSHYYILEVFDTMNKEKLENARYMKKSYLNFQDLSHDLKAEFPNKKLPKLPHKQGARDLDHLSSISSSSSLHGKTKSNTLQKKSSAVSTDKLNVKVELNDSVSDEGVFMDDDDEGNYVEPDDDDVQQNDEKSDFGKAPREKTRTALRQYLRKLFADKDIALSDSLKKFFNDPESKIDMGKVDSTVLDDVENRKHIDQKKYEDIIKLQKEKNVQVQHLQDSFEKFKDKLIDDDGYLYTVTEELRQFSTFEKLSDDLQNFIEIGKLFMSLAIYELFLGNENDSSFYSQVKRLHKLMPYSMMAQIFKVAVPMAIMKGITDLFMTQPFGGYSLLQTMFITILTEDLRNQNKVIKKLEKKIALECASHQTIIDCFKQFIDNKGSAYHENAELKRFKAEAESIGMPVFIVILIKNVQKGTLSQKVVDRVIESFTNWKTFQGNDGMVSVKEREAGMLYVYLEQLMTLYLKEHDKRLTRKMWQDPELSQLLKSVINLIYEPMVRVFKVAKVDVAFKNFERFMHDLIKLIDKVIYGEFGAMTKFDVIMKINELVTVHQGPYLELINDFYVNDSEGVIDEYIHWIESILAMLRNSTADRKSTFFIEQYCINNDINVEKLKMEVDMIIERKYELRQLRNSISLLRQKLLQEKTTNNETQLNIVKLEKKIKQLQTKSISKTQIEQLRALGFQQFLKMTLAEKPRPASASFT